MSLTKLLNCVVQKNYNNPVDIIRTQPKLCQGGTQNADFIEYRIESDSRYVGSESAQNSATVHLYWAGKIVIAFMTDQMLVVLLFTSVNVENGSGRQNQALNLQTIRDEKNNHLDIAIDTNLGLNTRKYLYI